MSAPGHPQGEYRSAQHEATPASAAARSVFFFGGYLVGLGALLLLVPALVLAPVGLPVPQDVWIRITGMLVMFLGVYYVVSARSENLAFIRMTVYVRGSVLVFFAGFVILGLAPMALLLLGAADLAGASWTAAALRQHRADHGVPPPANRPRGAPHPHP